MGRACGTCIMEEKPEEMKPLEDVGVDGRIKLKCIVTD